MSLPVSFVVGRNFCGRSGRRSLSTAVIASTTTKQKPSSNMSSGTKMTTIISARSKLVGNNPSNRGGNSNSRRLFSSSSGDKTKPDTKPPPTAQNIALATVLLAFCGGVFTYSLKQVGRSDEDSDPLAQLKAEAQEARAEKELHRKLSPEEIAALESGMAGSGHEDGGEIEVAVAAPAEIAELEEEANLKAFRQKQGEDDETPKKKKRWWRFGF